MKISIICVGKIKENYLKMAIEEYCKRISKYSKIDIIEIQDEKAPENLSKKQEEIIKIKEGERILKVLKDEFAVMLCIDGKQLNSLKFSHFFQDNMNNGISKLCFVIGGSLGLSDNVLNRADFKLSFSEMTFPHQLMRVILLEQIYRVFKILNNEPYHK